MVTTSPGLITSRVQPRWTSTTGALVSARHCSIEKWRAETNAPVVLVRRGWTRDVIKPGDLVTVDGWPSRDGRKYLRLRDLKDAHGKPIGTPFGQKEQS
jgi:hypothetical protein